MSHIEFSLYFWGDPEHMTGYLVVGDQHFELAGVRKSRTRADIRARKIRQMDLFDERGDSEHDQL